MDFPIFKEIFITQKDINNIYEFLEENIDFSVPCFMDVDGLVASEVTGLIESLKTYYVNHKRSVDSPYPLYLVGNIFRGKQFDWRNFVPNRDQLPGYFRRKIYLKNTGQIKELKKFLIYQYGIQEQDLNQTNKKLKSLSNQFYNLKNEKIQNLKLLNILRSFKSDGDTLQDQRNEYGK